MWRLPCGLRWYVCGVIGAAAAAAGAAAAFTGWRGPDLWLFTVLVAFGALTMELTRRTALTTGLNKDVHGIWQIPVALLLPPFYCLAAPVVTYGLLQLRTRRTIAHRRVFSAAVNGLSLAAASAVFHLLRSRLPWLQPGPSARTLAWLLAAAGCALLWSALNKTLMMTAVKASDPTVSVRTQLFAREAMINDLCEAGAALVLAGAVAGLGWPMLVPALPLVIVLQRSLRHAQLISQARFDAKTGLLNAATWRAEATVQLAQAQRTGSPAAVAIADLDHFKIVNDTHGHLVGDAVLAAAAAIFRAAVRPYDLLGRFGGEEFTVFLPDTSAAGAAAVADRLRASLAARPIPVAAGQDPLHITVSIGIAAVDGSASCDLTDLLTAADAALYAAKTAGRNAVHLAAPAELAGR